MPRTKTKTAPKLSGGNTIRQAEKPRDVPVTMPVPRGILPSHSDYEAVQKELEETKKALFTAQNDRTRLCDEVKALNEKLSTTQRILNRYGVGATPNSK